VILKPQEPLTLFSTHTFSQNTLWHYRIFTHFTNLWKSKYKNHERNTLHLSLQDSESSYDQTLNQCIAIQQSCKFLKNFFRNQSQSHCIWYLTCVFCFKIKAIFIALKTSHSRQHLWAKTVFDSLPKQINRFSKSCYEISQSTGWKVVLIGWIG